MTGLKTETVKEKIETVKSVVCWRGTNIITLYYQNDKSFSDATVWHKYTY